MKNFKFYTIGLIFLFSSITSNSNASIITYAYEGIVNISFASGVDSTPFTSLQGETIRVEYTYDTNTLNTGSRSDAGEYQIISSQLTIGMFTYTSNPLNNNQIIISNNFAGQTRDRYVMDTRDPFGSDIGGLSVTNFALSFEESTGLLYSDISLPSIQPNPGDFDLLHSIHINFQDPLDTSKIAFVSANSISVSAVPIPASIWLMFSGFIGLMSFARKVKHA